MDERAIILSKIREELCGLRTALEVKNHLFALKVLADLGGARVLDDVIKSMGAGFQARFVAHNNLFDACTGLVNHHRKVANGDAPSAPQKES